MYNKTTGRGFDSVTFDELRPQIETLAAVFGINTEKENTMKKVTDYILDRLIALRIIESPCIDERTCARVDELLLLLVELVDDAGE